MPPFKYSKSFDVKHLVKTVKNVRLYTISDETCRDGCL